MLEPTDDLAVIVVNFGSHADLEANLGSLDLDRSRGRVQVRVVVVDNYRSAEDRTSIEDLVRRHGWELVARPTNEGFGAAVGHGARRAEALGCSVLLLLNPDAHVDVDTMAALHHAGLARPRTITSPRVLRPDGGLWFGGASLDLRTGTTRGGEVTWVPERVVPWLSGACLAVHRDLWSELGGFSDEYFLYWEDVDLSYRAVLAGAELAVRHDLTAVHSVGGSQRAPHPDGAGAGVQGTSGTPETSDGQGKSALYCYYNCRNRLLFAAKHLPPPAGLRWLAGSPKYAASVLRRGGRRGPPSLRQLSAAVAGTLAGAGHLLRGTAYRRARSVS